MFWLYFTHPFWFTPFEFHQVLKCFMVSFWFFLSQSALRCDNISLWLTGHLALVWRMSIACVAGFQREGRGGETSEGREETNVRSAQLKNERARGKKGTNPRALHTLVPYPRSHFLPCLPPLLTPATQDMTSIASGLHRVTESTGIPCSAYVRQALTERSPKG